MSDEIEVKNIFDDIGHEAKHVGHQVQHTGGDIGHIVTEGVRQIQQSTSSGVSVIRNETQKGVDAIRHSSPELERIAEDAVGKVIVPVVSEIMKPIEKIVFTVGKDVLEECHRIAKETIGHDQSLIDDFNKISFYVANTGTVSLGMYFRHMWDRGEDVIKALRMSEKGIPARRHEIMDFIRLIGPDAVDVTISGKIPLVQIGGSVGAWGIPSSLLEHLIDGTLKKAGIPE